MLKLSLNNYFKLSVDTFHEKCNKNGSH